MQSGFAIFKIKFILNTLGEFVAVTALIGRIQFIYNIFSVWIPLLFYLIIVQLRVASGFQKKKKINENYFQSCGNLLF